MDSEIFCRLPNLLKECCRPANVPRRRVTFSPQPSISQAQHDRHKTIIRRAGENSQEQWKWARRDRSRFSTVSARSLHWLTDRDRQKEVVLLTVSQAPHRQQAARYAVPRATLLPLLENPNDVADSTIEANDNDDIFVTQMGKQCDMSSDRSQIMPILFATSKASASLDNLQVVVSGLLLEREESVSDGHLTYAFFFPSGRMSVFTFCTLMSYIFSTARLIWGFFARTSTINA